MFGEFIGKNVTIYMVNYANAMYNTYRVEGKMLDSNDRITRLEVEEKKRKFIQLINNGFVVYVEENLEPEKKEKKEKEKENKKNNKKDNKNGTQTENK